MRRSSALSTLVLATTALAACGKPALVSKPDRPTHAILVKDVAVLDVETGTREEHRDVLIRAGRIAEIGAAGTVKPTVGTQEIDGAGATLVPGLVDMHVHSGNPANVPWKHPLPDPDRNLEAFLYAGVTTVLDTGGLDDDAIKRRDRIAAGKLLGPRMYAVGPVVTEKGAHPVPMLKSLPWWQRSTVIGKHVRQVDDADAVRRAIAEIQGYKADFLKVAVDAIPDDTKHISDELLEEIGKQAKGRGMRMVAHIGTTEDALDAGRAGAAAWVHGVYRERIADEKIPELAKFGIPMVPTLVVFERLGTLADGAYQPTDLERETVDADILAELGFLYHGDWYHDDQPMPLRVRSGKLISLPYAAEVNDAPFLGMAFEADDFLEVIKRQFDTLYREGEHNARVMCISIHPQLVGQPQRAKYLDEALSYVFSHPGVWKTTADEIAQYYLAHHYDTVLAHLDAARSAR
jgi:hypothetical protein